MNWVDPSDAASEFNIFELISGGSTLEVNAKISTTNATSFFFTLGNIEVSLDKEIEYKAILQFGTQYCELFNNYNSLLASGSFNDTTFSPSYSNSLILSFGYSSMFSLKSFRGEIRDIKIWANNEF